VGGKLLAFSLPGSDAGNPSLIFALEDLAVTEQPLTIEQEAEAQRLAALILEKTKEETLRIARLLVSKADHELLGATEFQVRDGVHRIGAFALETALNERKKGGTTGRAEVARTARKRPGSTNTGPRTS
jgi:hypothetical protein